MGNLLPFASPQPDIVDMPTPVGAQPEDEFILVEIEDEKYKRFAVGSLLIFKRGFVSKQGVHLIKYRGETVLPVSLKRLRNGKTEATSLHPDVELDKTRELDIIGRLIEVYPPAEEQTRYILWQDDYQVTVRRKRKKIVVEIIGGVL